MEEKVKGILGEALKIQKENISDGLMMKDVDGWDSLKHMEIIVMLEEKFKIEFDFDEIVAMQSVREIKRVLVNKGVVH